MDQEQLLSPPLTGRNLKPRQTGITMVIDKGLSIGETGNLLQLNSEFIDFIKLAFGTILLYNHETLAAKIRLAKRYNVHLYPGGTFDEIAYWQQQTDNLYPRLQDLGFEWLEISDGTLTVSDYERTKRIAKARQAGFQVITEVGKKDVCNQLSVTQIAEQAQRDFENGAAWVIIEGRESGAGIGIYDQKGQIQTEMLEFLQNTLSLNNIIWEAPLKHQQAELITIFGSNVNLGNVPPGEAMALEALRQGLRSDTWQPEFPTKKSW